MNKLNLKTLATKILSPNLVSSITTLVALGTCLYSVEALAVAAEFSIINDAADGMKNVARDKIVPLIELLMIGGSGVAGAKMSTWWPVIGGAAGVGLFHYIASTIMA